MDTGDPNTAVKIYSSQDADELMFLDIDASSFSIPSMIIESNSFSRLLYFQQQVIKNLFLYVCPSKTFTFSFPPISILFPFWILILNFLQLLLAIVCFRWRLISSQVIVSLLSTTNNDWIYKWIFNLFDLVFFERKNSFYSIGERNVSLQNIGFWVSSFQIIHGFSNLEIGN